MQLLFMEVMLIILLFILLSVVHANLLIILLFMQPILMLLLFMHLVFMRLLFFDTLVVHELLCPCCCFSEADINAAFYAAVVHAVLLDAVAQAACVPFLTLLILLRHFQSFAV
jgi:hypothetical protein